MRKHKADKYQVDHPGTSGGPKFSSLSAALRYIAHCIRNGNRYMTISTLTVLFVAAVSAFGQLPDAPKQAISRLDFTLLAADATGRTLDTLSTRRALRNGNTENVLPDAITRSTGRLAAYEVTTTAVEFIGYRLLERHHRKLARTLYLLDIGGTFVCAGHNLTLPIHETRPVHRLGR